MGQRRILFVSSDEVAASLLERQLVPEFEVHSAATDEAAFALLDAYVYACVVVDLCARSTAGAGAASTIHLNAVTTPVIAIVPRDAESLLPQNAIACVNDEDSMARLIAEIRQSASK